MPIILFNLNNIIKDFKSIQNKTIILKNKIRKSN